MTDRDEIFSKIDKDYYIENYGYIPSDNSIRDVMDEYGKQLSIEFLKYALEKMGGHSIDAAGNVEVKFKGEWLTPEQLFENFL